MHGEYVTNSEESRVAIIRNETDEQLTGYSIIQI